MPRPATLDRLPGQAIGLLPLFGAFLSAALRGETLHRFHLVAWR